MKLPHLVIPLALALAGATATSAAAHQGREFGHNESPVVGHAYTDDNTAVSNTVAGFDRHADGSLTPISGSPFPVGGAGLGAGLPSQGAIQLSSDGRYLLAADAGSNQISVLRVGFNGIPQPVGAPVSSGGGEPLSIAVSGNLVYVANAGASAPNITGFILAPNGSLNPLPGSTVSLPAGSGPDDVLIDPRGRRLVVDLDNTSTIASFHVRHDGLLVAAPGSPIAAQGADRSARSSGRAIPHSCSSATPTAVRATERSRSSWRAAARVSWLRSAHPHSPIFRQLPAGWRSAMTDSSCSR